MKKMETDIENLAQEYKNHQTARQHLEDEIIRFWSIYLEKKNPDPQSRLIGSVTEPK